MLGAISIPGTVLGARERGKGGNLVSLPQVSKASLIHSTILCSFHCVSGIVLGTGDTAKQTWVSALISFYCREVTQISKYMV